METNIRILLQNLDSLSSFAVYDLWNHIGNGHTTIIVLASIAIAATLIMGAAILIRQQKIMRKLDELTKKTEETSAEDKP